MVPFVQSVVCWPKPFVVALCFLLLVAIGVVDYMTGMEVSVTVFYLIPIWLGTWAVSRRAGLCLAVGGILVWLTVEIFQGASYSHPLIQYWNAFVLLAFFVLVVLLLATLKASSDELDQRVRVRTAELARTNTELSDSQRDVLRTFSDLQKSHVELKATQLQLIQAAKMESVGQLAAGVAHEVKNPLMTITMGLDYLDQTPQAREQELGGVLKDMRDAAERSGAVINELLNFSAPGKLNLQMENLNSIIEQSLGLVKHELIKRQIAVVRDLQESLPRILLDRNKMEQVFVNGLINAAQAMPGGGTVTVRTYSSPAEMTSRAPGENIVQAGQQSDIRVTAEIEDSGIGIAEEDLARVFDPFFTTKKPGKGSGLGLSIVHQIVQLHGGMVKLSNREEGGARFAVQFINKGEAS